MKKTLLLFVAAATVISGFAQVSYNPDSFRRKISSAEADLNDPKKAEKGSTWMAKGDAYFNAAEAPIKGLYKGMIKFEIDRVAGVPIATRDANIEDKNYNIQEFKNYDLYLPEGKGFVSFWDQKVYIVQDGLDVAYEAYQKALELDPKLLPKIEQQLTKIVDAFKQDADLAMGLSDYKRAAASFIKAYDYGAASPLNKIDTMLAYNGGYLSVINKDFENAVKYLNEAKKYGFVRGGELYKLLFYAYEGTGNDEKSIETLKEGVMKYPTNAELVELLMNMYTKTGQDVSAIIPQVKSALEKDPNNYRLHFGLGLIYDKLKQFDKAAEEFAKSGELSPKDFGSFFNQGVAYIRSGEAMIPELNDIPVSQQAAYDAKLAEINNFYRKSIPPLERAHEIDPKDKSTVELLKTFYFRFRDESPEMMEKFEKFNALFQSME